MGSETYVADLQTVIPELDPATRTQTVIFRFRSDAIDRVVPAQVVRMELDQPLKVDGFRVPVDALVRGRRGLWAVFVAEEMADHSFAAMRRDVELLHSEGSWVVVRGTIREADKLVTNGTHRLANGQPVRLKIE